MASAGLLQRYHIRSMHVQGGKGLVLWFDECKQVAGEVLCVARAAVDGAGGCGCWLSQEARIGHRTRQD
jgi:hypothetical protein